MRSRLRRLFVAALASACLVTLAASAEPTKADLERARRLFEQASALEQAEAWREATDKLREALAIKETPGLHFHLAHCAEQLGELVRAAHHYGRAEELIEAGAEAPDVEELLSAARARVLARLPRLTLALPRGVEGAVLEVDGRLVEQEAGTPVLLDPGRHRVVARAPGRRDFEMEIILQEGQAQTLEVALAPSREATPSRTRTAPNQLASRADDRGGLGTRELVLVGEATFTLAALATGVGFSLARASASDRVARSQRAVDAAAEEGSSGCSADTPPRACAELDAALDDHARASRFALVGFVAAGAGAAATLLTWTLWPSEGAALGATIRPVPSGGALGVTGRF